MGRGLSIDTLMAEEGTFTLGAYRRQAPLPPESPSKPPRVRVSLPVAPDSSWRTRAACLKHDPVLWLDPPDGGFEALRVCDRCPVREECRDWAFSQSKRLRSEWSGMVVGGSTWSNGKPGKRQHAGGHPPGPRNRICERCGRCFHAAPSRSPRFCSNACRWPKGRWSRDHDACVSCGRTDIKHASHGRCQSCRNQADRRAVREGPGEHAYAAGSMAGNGLLPAQRELPGSRPAPVGGS